MQLKGNSLQRLTGFVEGVLTLPTSDYLYPCCIMEGTAGTFLAGLALAC